MEKLQQRCTCELFNCETRTKTKVEIMVTEENVNAINSAKVKTIWIFKIVKEIGKVEGKEYWFLYLSSWGPPDFFKESRYL